MVGSDVVDVGGKFPDVFFANDDICVVYITNPDGRRVGSSGKGTCLEPHHVDVGSQTGDWRTHRETFFLLINLSKSHHVSRGGNRRWVTSIMSSTNRVVRSWRVTTSSSLLSIMQRASGTGVFVNKSGNIIWHNHLSFLKCEISHSFNKISRVFFFLLFVVLFVVLFCFVLFLLLLFCFVFVFCFCFLIWWGDWPTNGEIISATNLATWYVIEPMEETMGRSGHAGLCIFGKPLNLGTVSDDGIKR